MLKITISEEFASFGDTSLGKVGRERNNLRTAVAQLTTRVLLRLGQRNTILISNFILVFAKEMLCFKFQNYIVATFCTIFLRLL